MAIPTWTWSGQSSDRSRASHPSRSSGPQTELEGLEADVSQLSSEFDLLASPVRLEILLAVADRDRPLRYTDLRAATSIEDNGKLNYHLRRLEGLVANQDDGDERGYVLTVRGRRLLERVPRTHSRSNRQDR